MKKDTKDFMVLFFIIIFATFGVAGTAILIIEANK